MLSPTLRLFQNVPAWYSIFNFIEIRLDYCACDELIFLFCNLKILKIQFHARYLI